MKKIAIIGSGAYGIALSRVLSRNNINTTIYTKFDEEYDMLNEHREHKKVLPGIILEGNTSITNSLEDAIKNNDILVVAVPSEFLRVVIKEIKEHINEDHILCIATKGIENNTGKLPCEIVLEEFDIKKLCVLTGPSYAKEIALYQPTTVTLAGNDEESLAIIKGCFDSESFRIETTDDMIGSLVSGAFKNILAIGSGILYSIGAGDNTRATLITRGIRELGLLSEALGGQKETVYLSCGLGDLLTTCIGSLSRNLEFGKLIGQGKTKEEALEIQNKTVEGYTALIGAMLIIEKKQLNLPLIKGIADIVINGVNPNSLLESIAKPL
jgi:glycerol-3-phosphate dehydrogenase (NAD(P)+)